MILQAQALKAALVGVLTLGLLATGWGMGWHQRDRQAQREAVAAAGVVAKQEAHAEAVVAQQNTITEAVEATSAASTHSLRSIYGPGRVRGAATSSGRLPAVPGPAVDIPPGPADPGLDPGEHAPPPDPCRDLRSDAAVTTMQFLLLRDAWERMEAAQN